MPLLSTVTERKITSSISSPEIQLEKSVTTSSDDHEQNLSVTDEHAKTVDNNEQNVAGTSANLAPTTKKPNHDLVCTNADGFGMQSNNEIRDSSQIQRKTSQTKTNDYPEQNVPSTSANIAPAIDASSEDLVCTDCDGFEMVDKVI